MLPTDQISVKYDVDYSAHRARVPDRSRDRIKSDSRINSSGSRSWVKPKIPSSRGVSPVHMGSEMGD
jgi:hypothetical protein